tara:strand:- start:381 stop:980 length:600 start_codon:yes stop_codon:yes gene_type:complete
MTEIFNYINSHTYEFFGVIFSIIYVILSIKQNVLCWLALIIAAGFNMYAYSLIQLPLQSIMQVFFIVTAFNGWYNWSSENHSKELRINTLNWNKHIEWICIGILSTVILTIILSYTNIEILNTYYPFADSFIFIFNIIPVYMMGKKVLESWIYFIIIDIYSGFFFYATGAYFFSFLFFCYIGFATYGYINWKKEIKSKK